RTIDRASSAQCALAVGHLGEIRERDLVEFLRAGPRRKDAAQEIMLVAIDISQLFRAIRGNVFHLRLGAIVMTGLRAQSTASTGFQCSFKRLIELRLESLACAFDSFSPGRPLLCCFGMRENRAASEELSKECAPEKEI